MICDLHEALVEIESQVVAATSLILFTDFDGTLAPLVEAPDQAKLLPGLRRVLHKLTERPGFVLAVISGRGLFDLAARVGVPDVVYAGNHGAEIRGRGLRFIEPAASSRRQALEALAATLAARLKAIDGVRVENKGLSATVHTHRLAAGEQDEVRRIVHAAVAEAGGLFRVTPGALGHEICPNVNWHKGTAVRWIAEQLGMENALAICLGDDFTDENAFAALPEGITIRVGKLGRTRARYCVKNPVEVRSFLAWLSARFNNSVAPVLETAADCRGVN